MSLATIPQFIRTVPLRAAPIIDFRGLQSDNPQVVVGLVGEDGEPAELGVGVKPGWIQEKGCQVGDYLMVYRDGEHVSVCPADIFAASYGPYVAPAPVETPAPAPTPVEPPAAPAEPPAPEAPATGDAPQA